MTTPDAIRKPRLLVLTSTYPRWPGDAEPGFVHELAKRLTDVFDVTVLGPHAKGAARAESLDGVKVVRFRYAPPALESLVNDGGIPANLRRSPWKWLLVPGFLLAMAWHAWRLSRQRPDLVHAHWLLPQGTIVALLGLLQRAPPPFVVTSHGADLFAFRARPLRALKRFVVHRAAAITVVSPPMRDELLRLGAGPAHVDVQPMGVDLRGRFTVDPAAVRSRDEILFVGRLVEKKGLRHLIDAMPAILAAHPSAYLTVVGFGPEEAERRLQARAMGLEDKVRFAGPVSQSRLPAFYRRAAMFVAPFTVAGSGDQEGLGLVAMEAAGCGCPLVVSAMAQTRDAFDGDCVAWTTPGDAKALAAACIKVLSDPEAAAKRAIDARASALARFDWASRATGYRDLMMGLVRAAS